MLIQAEKIHQLILIHSLLENYSFGELSSYLCFVINDAVLTSLLWIALMHTLGSSIFRVSIRGKEAGFIDVLMKHWLPDLAQ